ncbi:3402_t:CDS:10 [Dentiscutata erythropus]|uniref:3402_t:CDS:1 n=1 Tax=Dentiscutata erythropus TaxID=1348616 RepID=A0A9N8YTA0_9GLOM|nr:3402_t:CDS:10 [Dentiscutata erythropus]
MLVRDFLNKPWAGSDCRLHMGIFATSVLQRSRIQMNNISEGVTATGLSRENLQAIFAHASTATSSSDVRSASTTALTSQTPLSQEQLSALKYQILAFKLISHNLEVPTPLQQAMFSPGHSQGLSTQELSGTPLTGKIVEASYNHHSRASPTPTTETVSSAQASISTPPYNAFTNPLTYLKPVNTYSHASRQQRMLIPAIMPIGLDPNEIAAERERQLKARALQRILELEYTIEAGSYQNQSEKNRILIQLKALKLLDKQKRLRQEFIKGMAKSTTLATTTNRSNYRRMKKQSIRDARITDRLEKQQREDRQRHQKQKHLDRIQSICNHGREMIQWHRVSQGKQLKLGRTVVNYHSQVEKEEQKRMERLSKERLRALKNDDEEAYLKLIDQVKDTRITHLLKQTDQYLDSLAQAVVAQQRDDLHNDPTVRGEIELMDEEDVIGEDENITIVNGKKVDYYAVAHRIKEEVEQPGMLIGGNLKDYQVKGLQWMVSLYNNRLNGILADEMGLGKTIQTISLVTYLIEKKKQNGPFLIVVPLSTLTNWTIEFDRWAPTVRKCVYKGAPNTRKELQQQFIKHVDFQVLLTTYEYIIKDKSILSKLRWVYVIIDEGHRMKNTKSKLSVILTNNYQCRYRLILTGTPLQNNLPELWSLLNFILPRIFDSVKSFDEWFNTPFANAAGQDKIALNEEESLLIIRRLHKVLRPFLLRRLKKDVESELPDKVETVIKCKLSALQLKLYSQMKKHGVLFVNTGEKGKTGIKGLNNTIMQLRKICNHPFVFEEVEKDINPGNTNTALLYRVSGKFELLDRILPKFFSTGHRVLIFFQMTAIMTIMEDYLNWRGFKYLRLDGNTKAENRSDLLKSFNSVDSPYFVFLLSTRAGGLGLNLQTADTVIIFDSDWNPHQDLQAQDRAHRIGQTREVRILRLISQKSIEETILARAQYKLDIDEKVIKAARNEDELVKFKEMDQERSQKEEADWKKSGGKGKRPERLIGEYELPPVYIKEYNTIVQQDEPGVEYGRGQRPRGSVHYDDGLTEEQWVNAIEDEDIDVEELIAKRQAAKKRRFAKKSQKPHNPGHPDISHISTPHPDESSADTSEYKKKRGRPRKDEMPSVDDDNAHDIQSKQSKKKGKGKRVETSDFETFDQPKIKKRKQLPKKLHEQTSSDTLSAHTRDRMRRIFNRCYTAVENLMDDTDGEPRQRAYLFLTLPSKKEYDYYYTVINNPIAMDTIKRRVKTNFYQSAAQFRDDWHLMFNNARTFNEEASTVYNDAEKLQEVFDETFEELCPGGQILPSGDEMDI